MFKKVSLQFVFYFLGFYATLVILISSLFYIYLVKPILNFEMYDSIRIVQLDELTSHILEEPTGHFTFSDELTLFVESNHGVLQLINEFGQVISTTSTEAPLPDLYSFSDLATFKNHNKWFTWSLENEMTLLFTELTSSELLLEHLLISDDFPNLTEDHITLLENNDATFDLFSESGKLLFTTNEEMEKKSTEVIATTLNVINTEELKSFHTLDDNSVAIVRVPNEKYESFSATNLKVFYELAKAIIIFHVFLLILVLIFSFLIGRSFGRPIMYFLRKIDRLAKQNYEPLNGSKLRNKRTGHLKLKYRLYRDVDHSLTTLTETLKENEEKILLTEKLREDWITGLSHDLKTPLSTVLGYSMMLGSKHKWTDEEVLDFAKTITDKATYMDGLIDDLTYTYQLKNKGVQLNTRWIDLNLYVCNYFQNKSEDNIELIKSDSTINVILDEKRFARVLENIIGNAVKHNPEDTKISLSIYSEKDKAILEVADNGIGINREILENLFNRYYRGTNTTTDNIGTGLGLTIARQLVEAHNGTINVMSNASGTTVVITLPLA